MNVQMKVLNSCVIALTLAIGLLGLSWLPAQAQAIAPATHAKTAPSTFSSIPLLKLPDGAAGRPSLVSGGGRLYLAWTGTNAAHNINLESSTDGFNFGNKATFTNLRTLNGQGPALSIYNGALYIAWTGTNKQLNFVAYNGCTGSCSLPNVVTLADASNFGPALVTFGGAMYIGWTGTDTHLNIALARGVSSCSKYTYGDRAASGPALAEFMSQNTLYFGWGGTDSNNTLNLGGFTGCSPMYPDSHYQGLSLNDGPAMSYWNSSQSGPALWVLWTGKNTTLQLGYYDGNNFILQAFNPPPTASYGPAVSAFIPSGSSTSYLYFVWVGTDQPNHSLNIGRLVP